MAHGIQCSEQTIKYRCCYITSCQSSVNNIFVQSHFLRTRVSTSVTLSLFLSLIVCVLFCLIYLLEYFIQDTFYMTSHYLTNNKLAQWNEIECYSCLLFLSTFIWVFVCATCDSLRQWLKALHLLTRANCTAVLFKAILFLSSFIAFWWMLCASFIQSFSHSQLQVDCSFTYFPKDNTNVRTNKIKLLIISRFKYLNCISKNWLCVLWKALLLLFRCIQRWFWMRARINIAFISGISRNFTIWWNSFHYNVDWNICQSSQ